MITAEGFRSISNFLISNISHGQYQIDNQWQHADIYEIKLEDQSVIFYFHLDDTVTGKITRKRLVQKDGAIFDDQSENIHKTAAQNYLLAFRYNLHELERS